MTSAYFGDQWRKANVAQEAQVKRLVSQQEESRKAYAELSELLTEDAKEILFQTAFSDTTLAITNLRAIHRITVNYIAPGKVTSSAAEQTLDSMSDPVPNSELRSVRVNLSGSYITYQSFREYLKELEKLPVSVVQLKLHDSSFELGLRIYGK